MKSLNEEGRQPREWAVIQPYTCFVVKSELGLLIKDNKMNKEPIEHKKPRISLNKLGEYLTAKAGRRGTILKNAKYPDDYIVARNNDFYSTLEESAIGGRIDSGVIAEAINCIESRLETRKWHAENNVINAELLRKLIRIADKHQLANYVVKKSLSTMHLHVRGVDISLRPDLLVETVHRGSRVMGFIKLHLSKSHALTQVSWSVKIGQVADPT